jgi:hypothetical protein
MHDYAARGQRGAHFRFSGTSAIASMTRESGGRSVARS